MPRNPNQPRQPRRPKTHRDYSLFHQIAVMENYAPWVNLDSSYGLYPGAKNRPQPRQEPAQARRLQAQRPISVSPEPEASQPGPSAAPRPPAAIPTQQPSASSSAPPLHTSARPAAQACVLGPTQPGGMLLLVRTFSSQLMLSMYSLRTRLWTRSRQSSAIGSCSRCGGYLRYATCRSSNHRRGPDGSGLAARTR